MSNGPLGGQPGAAFPKRFYTAATVGTEADGFVLLLDGRPARTPAKSPLVLPTAALAEAVADEWNAVENRIDPREMPLTRLANSVIDGVSSTGNGVRAEILRYAGSDLLVYRAAEPAELVAAQRAAWDPILAWARDTFDAAFTTGTGVTFVPQPVGIEARLGEALSAAVGQEPAASFRLGALHVMTTLTGSTLLALAVAHGRLDAAEAWTAAHVDEDHQIAEWGADAEATDRRARRWTEMETAARTIRLLRA